MNTNSFSNNNTKIEDTFLTLKEIKALLQNMDSLKDFWAYPESHLEIQCPPQRDFPIYEIQLVYHCAERIESYGWIWIDALGGEILSLHLEK